jgi:hypothetical protein
MNEACHFFYNHNMANNFLQLVVFGTKLQNMVWLGLLGSSSMSWQVHEISEFKKPKA